jgi:putative ABC transport system permease protein
VLVARLGARLLVVSSPTPIPGLGETGLDWAGLAFVAVLSVVAGLACGAIPALHYSRPEVLTTLREAGRGALRGRRGAARGTLVVGEIALAVMLVIGAGLLTRSFVNLSRVDVGFRTENLLVAGVELPETRYGDAAMRTQFVTRVMDGMRAIPGVRSVGAGLEHPLSPGWTSSFRIAEHPAPRAGTAPEARIRPVTSEYFATVGLPLRAGRAPTRADIVGAPGVVVVNEAFVREHFGGASPLGKHVDRASWWPGMPSRFEIIGVVADEKFMGLQNPAEPALYFSLPQFALVQYFVLRTSGDAAAISTAARNAVWAVDRALPVDDVFTIESALRDQLDPIRFNAMLLAAFGITALTLAALGIYGVVSASTAERTSEIGVRIALGASAGSVLRLVVRRGVILAMAGVGVGLVGAFAGVRILERLLFDVEPVDPVVFGSVAVMMIVVGCAAAFLPARRATRIDPMDALRADAG